MSSPVAFAVQQAIYDPEKPHLLWVLIASTDEEPNTEYAARLWITTDGSNPQDWRNPKRQLAQLDTREMDGAPEDEPFTTIITGLRANRLAFGLPVHTEIMKIDHESQAEIVFYVECCQETEQDEQTAESELLDALNETDE